MSRSICVVGTGYVGLIAAAGLADFGNNVVGVDLDSNKISMLSNGKSPIYEPGIELYLERNLQVGRLKFDTDIAGAIQASEVILISVGTPPKETGEADLQFVGRVAETIANNLNNYKVIVTKSTVPVGTNRWIRDLIAEKSGKLAGTDFDVVSNPEFLREGQATQDFFHPDRTVIGYESSKAREIMTDVYRALNLISVPFVWCGLETAELIKYASNAYLATKITFINEMANLAEAVGADIHMIAKSMGMDGRIGPKFLHPGPGYGGSCFPKDTQAVVRTGDKFGIDMSVIRAVNSANEYQKSRIAAKLAALFIEKTQSRPGLGVVDQELQRELLAGKTIAVCGLAFKQETDDIRDAPSITLVRRLLDLGATVKAHDPKAMINFAKFFPEVEYSETSYGAMTDVDAVVLMTEWNEYRSLDLGRMASIMRGKRIMDARNLLEPKEALAAGFRYDGIGRSAN